MIKIKRIYEPAAADDGYRVLVDRIWPRGLSKEAVGIDEWLRDVAPSADLRRWFGHKPERWREFAERFARELEAPSCIAHLDRLRNLARKGPVTLLYAARDEVHNNAVVIRRLLALG